MPNIFAPRVMDEVMETRASELRQEHEKQGGSALDVKEWHALLDMLDEDTTEEFLSKYRHANRIPEVVDGIDRSDDSDGG